MILHMCSGVETIASYNHRPLYRAFMGVFYYYFKHPIVGENSVFLAMMGKDEAGSNNRVNYRRHGTLNVL